MNPALRALLCCALAILPLAVRPQGLNARSPIMVVRAWARATPPGASVGGVYLTIKNSGRADSLIGVLSPVCGHAEMHSMSMSGGMMRMRPLTTVTIPAHGEVSFAPDVMHIMLVDLRQPLHQGGHVPVTLTFRAAGPINVDVPIGDFGADKPPSGH